MAISLNHQAKVATTSFLLFCFSLFLTAYSARHPEVARAGFSLIAKIQRPFQVVSNNINVTLSGFWDGYIDLRNARIENGSLKERLDTLEAYNSRLLEFKYENDRLRKLLSYSEKAQSSSIASTVISFDPSSISQSVIVDKGSLHGVNIEMPVLLGESVVGQVIAVANSSSKVLLITDPSSAVDAIVQGTRVRGIVRGTSSSSTCDLIHVEREEIVKIGDRVITSGLDEVFPKGLLIGVVSDVVREAESEFQKIEILPSVDFSKLENVLVVTSKASKQSKGE
jgi:rod shape-determining protein MreC